MRRNQVLDMVRDAIFAKTSGFNDIEDIKEDSGLSSDLAMDSLDYVEVIMDIEKTTGRRISNYALGDTSVDGMTVGRLTDMLHAYLKDV